MGQTVRFQETLPRLAMIDEGFVEDEAGLGLDPAGKSTLDRKTAALLQVGVGAWPTTTEAGMATHDQPGYGRTVVLRRQRAERR